MTIGERIKELRRRNDLTQEKLSGLLRALLFVNGQGNSGILDSRRAICDILRIMLPDENYLYYHDFLFISRIDEARADRARALR